MTYSFGKMLETKMSKVEIYKKVTRRSALLFAIGHFMAIFPLVQFDPFGLYDFSSVRIMGILQRIGFCYLFASIIFLEFQKIRLLVFWTIGILAGYWLLMMTIPVPEYGAGDLSREGNLASYLDQLILGGHLLEVRLGPGRAAEYHSRCWNSSFGIDDRQAFAFSKVR